jgi:phosphoserine phosphatase
MVAPKRCASASATADLPLAVGPAMRSARCRASVLPAPSEIVMPALVATIVADPSRARLSDEGLDAFAQAAPGFEGRAWLDQGMAADLFFQGELATTRAAMAAAIAGKAIDVIVQPKSHRAKRLLVADMDSTLIGQECVDELAAYAGVGAKVAAITERAMRGEIAFEPALRERVSLLAGLPAEVIEIVLTQRIQLNPGARTVARTMRARGARVAIVSGGFRQFTAAILERIGGDQDRGNTLEIEGRQLTGRIVEPVLGQDAKLEALKEIAADMGLSLAQTMAVGDGANDLAMLQAAGLGVAYRAKPKVAAAADARIDHADLTALLFAQGIPRREFIED